MSGEAQQAPAPTHYVVEMSPAGARRVCASFSDLTQADANADARWAKLDEGWEVYVVTGAAVFRRTF